MEDPRNTGFGLLGVAPKAELGMYRVFGCSGDAESDIILSAMLQAQTDGANVISMSLGAATPDEEEDPYQSVTTALAESGVAVFAANGNDAGLYDIHWCQSILMIRLQVCTEMPKEFITCRLQDLDLMYLL